MTPVTEVDEEWNRCSAELRQFSHRENGASQTEGMSNQTAVAPPPAKGCLYDTQCKGNRICESGNCVNGS
jgi:hypothetical protein